MSSDALNVHESRTSEIDWRGREDVLAKRAAAGGKLAFEQLVGRFDRVLRNRAYRYHLPFGDFDDLMQEGRLGLWEAVRRWKPGKPFVPLAVLCIEHNMINALKSQLALGHRAANNAGSLEDRGPDGIDAPLHERVEDISAVDAIARMILSEEIQELIDRVQAELTPLERQALVMRSMGYRQTEIAEALGTSPGSVNTALGRARRRLGIDIDDSAHSAPQVERMVVMYESGVTAKGIADHFGISDGTVRRILRKRNVTIRPRGLTGQRSHFASRLEGDSRLPGGER